MGDPFHFVDIHSHILPAVDDGARSLEESVSIIKEAVGVGRVKSIVLTPHISVDGIDRLNLICEGFNILCKFVKEMGIDISLHLGAELFLHPELPARITEEKRLTTKGSGKYVLIEMPSYEIPIYAPNVFFEILAHGIIPIWAHPERCYEVMDNYKAVYHYMDNGVLLQINAGSLLGMYGKKVRSTAATLVKNGCGHIMASDVHRADDVKTLLPEAFSHLVKMVGDAKAVDMVLSTPTRIINGF